MAFIIFICSLIFIIYFIMSFLDIFDNNKVKKRLNKIAQSSQRLNNRPDSPKDIKNYQKYIEPINEYASAKINEKSLKKLMLEAGLSADQDDIYKVVSQKVLYALIGFIIAVCLAIVSVGSTPLIRILLLIIIPIVLFRLPDMRLRRLSKYRSDEIKYNMPDTLDLLTVCVEAGLGLDASFVRVSNEISRTCPVIAQEFSRIAKEIRAGIPRQTAYRNLAYRNNVPDLNTFVALLIQTEKLGTSIGQSLRIYSDTMRTKRRQRVEALAAQASIKMIIPLVFFVMPSMFVVLLGPAALQFISVFSTSK